MREEGQGVCVYEGLCFYGQFEDGEAVERRGDGAGGFCPAYFPDDTDGGDGGAVPEAVQGEAGFHQGCGWLCDGEVKGRQAEEGLRGVPVRPDAGHGPCRGGYSGADGDVL